MDLSLIHHSYGGIYERGSREYTLDDFYSLALDKMDRYVCLKKSDVVIPDGDVESSSDEDDDEDEDDTDADDDPDDEAETETLVDLDTETLAKDDGISKKAINSIPEAPDEESLAVKVLPTSEDEIDDKVRIQT